MNLIDTTRLRSCPDCSDVNELICLLDGHLSASGAAVLNNARFGLNIPVNRHADMSLLRYRQILQGRSLYPSYAGAASTAQIEAAVKQIIYRNGL